MGILKLNIIMQIIGYQNGLAMFDPVLLRSFVAVADCQNFTRAAERLHLTQSTVSQQVRRLEESLGCQLLDVPDPELLRLEPEDIHLYLRLA